MTKVKVENSGDLLFVDPDAVKAAEERLAPDIFEAAAMSEGQGA